MSSRTAVNSPPRGLVEEFPVPAEVHHGKTGDYASFGAAVPVHCCTQEQVEKLRQTTHHYTDIFTDQILAPLGELAYVRIDNNTAEKVFINRTKRLLVTSSDGLLASWRAAPTFESANCYLAGSPLVDKDGALVSLVTARRGNHYAVSSFDGEGGYFDTPLPWKIVQSSKGSIYGETVFPTRDALRNHLENLAPVEVSQSAPPQPVLHLATPARLVLLAQNGRQISHQYLPGIEASTCGWTLALRISSLLQGNKGAIKFKVSRRTCCLLYIEVVKGGIILRKFCSV